MDKIAGLLDVVCLVIFGAWAYLVAKRRGRDEIVWLLAAAAAFFVPGYLVQEFGFPYLAEKFGWAAAWRKPAGFIAGGLGALILDLYLTLFVPPAARGAGGPTSQPPGGAANG